MTSPLNSDHSTCAAVEERRAALSFLAMSRPVQLFPHIWPMWLGVVPLALDDQERT